MSERRDPAIYSIGSERPFSDTLVEGVIAQFGSDPLSLSRGVIFLPNNRAVAAIRDAFVRRAGNGLLLPRLVVIGDPEMGENAGLAIDPMNGTPILPAIDPLLRQLILARKIQEAAPQLKMGAIDSAQAMRLARSLAGVIDLFQIEQVPASRLAELDLSGLSEFWEESLKLLTIIMKDWPEELAKRGQLDLAERRNRQLERLAHHLKTVPQKSFVLAAGISTSAPAIAGVVRQIGLLPKGQVVLAGLDLGLDDDAWLLIAGDEEDRAIESHPQYHISLLLQRMGMTRGDVRPWPWSKGNQQTVRRARLVSQAMLPAKLTPGWAELDPKQRYASGIAALELADPASEALCIALALREAIEAPGKTAALVTPDRDLSKRVSAHLKRWGIEADDSAGTPLAMTAEGQFLLSIATAASAQFSPTALLSLLKHPLASGGGERRAWLDGVRALDLGLRGPMGKPHLAGITALLKGKSALAGSVIARALAWWENVVSLLLPLEQIWRVGASPKAVFGALRETASALAGERAWAGVEGRQVSALIEQLEALADEGPAISSMESLPQFLNDIMREIAVRPAYGGHPRLSIWGLLEAKLQSADLMILGGLNEGVWPQQSLPDPWLPPAIRRQLKLPGLEFRIGLSAHDFASALGAKQVLITRSRRDGRSPTIASRFLRRLDTFSAGLPLPSIRYDLLAAQLDKAKGQRAAQPAPAPPTDDRPRKISVTQVDGLKADPFAFYARHMLGLVALEKAGAEPDARWRGTFLHEILRLWGQEDDYRPMALQTRLVEAFETSALHPVIRAFWLPRFKQAAQWFEATVELNRADGREPVAAEIAGSVALCGVRLYGIADRIDRLADGTLAIVDYKTGAPPSAAQITQGYALQLGLLGGIAESGQFDGVKGIAGHFEYWSQARESGKSYGYAKSAIPAKSGSITSDSFVDVMTSHFREAVEAWLTGSAPFVAKLHPDYAFHDYDHLMRLEEWQGRNG